MAGITGRVVPVSFQARRMTAGRMLAVRGWTAPRLRRTAIFFDSSVAPRITAVLSGTAAWIEPPRRRRVRAMAVGTMAVMMASVATAMLVTRRRHQMSHLLRPEEETLEAERRYRDEQTAAGTYTQTSGYGSSYSGVGQGSGAGRSKGVGGE